MTPRSPDIPRADGVLAAPAGKQGNAHRRHRLAWLGALRRLPRHVARTMPWVPLLSGCAAGLAFLVILADLADTYHHSLSQGTVRFAFLPAIAGLAFVLRVPFRPLTQVTPVPAWVTAAGHLLLAAPVLLATGWAELRIMGHTIPAHSPVPAPVYPLIAQLAGWCAITVAAAACVERSRYADLGGAIAVPVTFAAIALCWYVPGALGLLAGPSANARGLTIAWYAVAIAAASVGWMAMRDQWHRYSRHLGGTRTPGGP